MEIGEKVITCRYDPAHYISDRRACLFEIIKRYRELIPDEFFDWLYSGEVNLWEVDGIEMALLKFEKYIGKTILTLPRGYNDP